MILATVAQLQQNVQHWRNNHSFPDVPRDSVTSTYEQRMRERRERYGPLLAEDNGPNDFDPTPGRVLLLRESDNQYDSRFATSRVTFTGDIESGEIYFRYDSGLYINVAQPDRIADLHIHKSIHDDSYTECHRTLQADSDVLFKDRPSGSYRQQMTARLRPCPCPWSSQQ